MGLKWDENWLRSYRITFGTREVVLDDFYYNVPSNLARPKTQGTTPDTVIPSDSISLSNLQSDGQDLRGFYFEFESNLSFESDSASSEDTSIRLKNLPKSVINFMDKEDCLVMVELGYGGEVEVAYTGDLVTYDVNRQGADLEYVIKLSSGSVNKRSTVVNTSYEKGISEKKIIEDLASKFSNTSVVTVGLEDLDKRVTRTKRTFTGDLITNFEALLDRYQLNYAQQNGKIVVIPYRLKSSTVEDLSVKNFELNPPLIHTISDIVDRSGESNTSKKNKKSKIKVTTPYIPIELGQAFTIVPEDSEYLLDFSGTFLLKARKIYASRDGQFSVTLQGDILDVG